MFINDHHLSSRDHVLIVALIQLVRFQRRVYVMQQTQIGRRVETVARLQQIQTNQSIFNFLVAQLGQFDLSVLFIHHVITSGLDIWLPKNSRRIVECLLF